MRRCERRIGELVRAGQDAGEILRNGQSGAFPNGESSRLSPTRDIFDNMHRAQTETYAMTDGVSDEQFEEGEPASPAMPYGSEVALNPQRRPLRGTEGRTTELPHPEGSSAVRA